MRTATIIFAALIAIIGLRLLLTGLRTIIMFFKVDGVPIKAKERLFKDLAMGILCLVLAFFLLI